VSIENTAKSISCTSVHMSLNLLVFYNIIVVQCLYTTTSVVGKLHYVDFINNPRMIPECNIPNLYSSTLMYTSQDKIVGIATG
jgi:hypothetical protein